VSAAEDPLAQYVGSGFSRTYIGARRHTCSRPSPRRIRIENRLRRPEKFGSGVWIEERGAPPLRPARPVARLRRVFRVDPTACSERFPPRIRRVDSRRQNVARSSALD